MYEQIKKNMHKSYNRVNKGKVLIIITDDKTTEMMW